MPSRLDRSRFGRSRFSASRFGGGAFGSGPAPALPTITVTGGTITPFSRGGVDYVEILFQQSGSFTVSGDVPWHNRALAGGGANGGRVGSTSGPFPGGGGAGGLLRVLGTSLAAGTYTVNIGAGAPSNATSGAGADGSASSLVMPSGTDTALGGGKGASSGVGNTEGANGGSGGGGRGNTGGASALGGLGTPGQGYAGGAGFISSATSGGVAVRAGGGGGGAGGPGGDGADSTAGAGGLGVLIDWIATPRTVCQGARGCVAADTDASPDAVYGSGSRGSMVNTVGKGGDGFLFLVVRADQASVVVSTVTVPSGAAISTFTRNGTSYTQALMDNMGGQIVASGPVAGASIALVPPGGAGGRTAGAGTRAGGGAGGLPRIQRNVTLPAGTYTITQGTPGAGTTLANGWGGNGTDSTMAGPIALTAPGGGGGGGNVGGQTVGRDGGNGGGGMGASSVGYSGGASTSDGYPGGAGYANADNSLKSGGGGGGAGGAGGTGTSGVGGAGGLGVEIEFMNPVRRVAGGAGGSSGTAGTGQDGGTNAHVTTQPGWGAGSGACVGVQPADGGLPFFVLVVPSANANIVTG